MKQAGWEHISSLVLAQDYCCGCGVCTAVCPDAVLDMRFNEQGEYRPCLIGTCIQCGMCAGVCPFVDENANEDEIARVRFSGQQQIKHCIETGYYLDAYIGHLINTNDRLNSASGGLATWLLGKLLDDHYVDYVLSVAPSNDGNALFKYKVCASSDDVRRCSSSCYYPVTTQEVLSFVAENEGRYAIVGLPCVCKSLRLSQQCSKLFRDRIKFVIGLVCGQTKSKSFVEYLCAAAGGNPHKLQKVAFRVKDTSRPASDYGLRLTWEVGGKQTEEATVFWNQGMGRVWRDRFFTPQACSFCDDVFAECADIAFMDAWLPDYVKNPLGHNLVLIRDECLNRIFSDETEHSSQTILRRIGIDSLVKSQLGVLCAKRGGLRDRIRIKKNSGLNAPRKRWNSSVLIHPIGFMQFNLILERISRMTGRAWTYTDKNLEAFLSEMEPSLRDLEVARQRMMRFRIPNAVLRKGGLFKKWALTRFYS